ncbi:MAG TPA: NAD-dependent protein deacylase, partial [Clostridia bacterium]|nr:NAD-dependent protein deacylase [Clostridia bacterium]
KFKKIIDKSRNIVFLGGAGVSTESGIPDFRSAKGLYSKAPFTDGSPEYMLSRTFFDDNTTEFYEYYRKNMLYPKAKPNKAHIALKDLELQGKLSAVITQNIDGLHQAAGSKTVYELHGSVFRNFCMSCNESYGLDYVQNSSGIPLCKKCKGIIKPDVVLYGEGLNGQVIEAAINAVITADTLIVGGTSLEVNPAASLVEYFGGGSLVIINMSPTKYDEYASLIIRKPIAEIFSSVMNL